MTRLTTSATLTITPFEPIGLCATHTDHPVVAVSPPGYLSAPEWREEQGSRGYLNPLSRPPLTQTTYILAVARFLFKVCRSFFVTTEKIHAPLTKERDEETKITRTERDEMT